MVCYVVCIIGIPNLVNLTEIILLCVLVGRAKSVGNKNSGSVFLTVVDKL